MVNERQELDVGDLFSSFTDVSWGSLLTTSVMVFSKDTSPSFSEVFSKQCLEKWRQAVSVFVFSLGETKTLTAFGPACLHLAKARLCLFLFHLNGRRPGLQVV